MKRVLITGSLGYIGSVLTNYLNERGYDCVGYDTGFFRDSLLYPEYKTKTIFKDVRDIVKQDLQDIDVLIHLAGISNDPMGKLDPSTVYDPTRLYSLKLAKLCKDVGVRFIFASSCSVYGVGGEDSLSESSEVKPQTPYSLNKLQIEQDLISLSDRDFSPIALRFATIFGMSPRIRLDVVVNMMTAMAVADNNIILNSDGMSWRPNLHIQDACQAILRAIELNYEGGELMVLNVGTEENNLRIIDIAKIIEKNVEGSVIKYLKQNPELDNEGLIRDRKIKNNGDTRTYRVSFKNIRQCLPEFKCEWSVQRGVKEMASEFARMSLGHKILKNIGFYRLQQLEYLLDNRYISNDLRWLKAI